MFSRRTSTAHALPGGTFLALLLPALILAACGWGPQSRRYQALLHNSGFIEQRDTILQKGRAEFELYGFAAGDRVADIGCGTGWFEGYLVMAYDSLEIYAQDIDRKAVRQLPVVIARYAALDTSSRSNQLHYVVGRRKRTRLPDAHFDRIVLRETFHHFSAPRAMLRDIAGKLRCDGRLLVYEPHVERTTYSAACKAYLLDRAAIIAACAEHGLVLERAHELVGNPGNAPPWITVPEAHREKKLLLVFRKVAACGSGA